MHYLFIFDEGEGLSPKEEDYKLITLSLAYIIVDITKKVVIKSMH